MRFIQSRILLLLLGLSCCCFVHAQRRGGADSAYIAEHFTKMERMIPMRDGVRLFTSIYVPKQEGQYPILMERTPYSCAPYGESKMITWFLGPDPSLMKEGYIFVYQDVRGRYKSEGKFEEMTPAIDQKTDKQTDESSDTYDTIDWLLKNLNANGRVGLYGISYPGFYASASLPDAHPAIRAVSPQAPVTDEFIGDDAYHNGAFFLMDNFDFTQYFEGIRNADGTDYTPRFEVSYNNAYDFFKNLGPIKHTNDPQYFNHQAKIWDEYLKHDVYDEYWKKRNIRTHLKNIRPAVLVVGGLFDAEDMFGAMRTYEAIEQQTPGNNNRIVLGPWTHGAWSRPHWDHFGPYQFGEDINPRFHEIQAAFFNYYLKDKGSFDLSEATVFETGSNQWRSYTSWPPKESTATTYYLGARGNLVSSKPSSGNTFDQYVSDPASPVPYTGKMGAQRNNEYLAEDQRFASARKDVLSYQSEPLTEDLRIAGRIQVNLFVSTSGTDADFVVKLIDVQPVDAPDPGAQRMVRADVFRGKFRNSYETPVPFVPNQATPLHFELNEAAHTFKKGHRIMVQIQSSWFPLVDINPQTFTDIPTSEAGAFRKATIRVYRAQEHASAIVLPVIAATR